MEASPPDAYARLPYETGRAWYPTPHTGSICFLDVSASDRSIETISGYLNALPPSMIARSVAVLVRWGAKELGWPAADEAAAGLHERLRRLGHNAPVGVIPFEVARDPYIVWSTSDPPSDDATLLARARAIELHAFLMWGEAIWRPNRYHYLLPSGRHATTFVRVADAFQDARAPGALATWLYSQLDTERSSALVIDTGALSSLAAELRLAIAQAAFAKSEAPTGLLPVYALDAYPESNLVLQQHLAKSMEGVQVIGLVSVSHSGTLAARLRNALSSITDKFVVEQLVRRNGPHAVSIPATASSDQQVTDPWLALNDENSPRDCAACGRADTAQLVRIDPRSMSVLLLPEPNLVVPDVVDAQRNSSIFNLYLRSDVAGNLSTLDEEAVPISYLGPTKTRSDGTPGLAEVTKSVFFEPSALVTDGTIRDRIQKLTELRKSSATDTEPTRIAETLHRIADQQSQLILFDRREYDLLEQLGVLQLLVDELSELHGDDPTVATFCVDDGDGRIEDAEDIEAANVLIVALGVRTGVTLHRMFLGARDRWPTACFAGVALHAHPSDSRIWASAQNTFRDTSGNTRLLALWLTYLPDWSPLRLEQDFLERSIPTLAEAVQDGSLSSSVLDFAQERLAGLASGRPSQALWGQASQVVRQGSYFGDQLPSSMLIAAVGSALHSSRLRARGPHQPQWIAVDMPRVFRSYFDGTIHAAAFRWVARGEGWWGASGGTEAVQLIEELRHQQKPDWGTLLPELLLAGAMGKLPVDAVNHLTAVASEPFDGRDEIANWIDLGVALIEQPDQRRDDS